MQKSAMESASWQRPLYGFEISQEQVGIPLKREFSDSLGGAIPIEDIKLIHAIIWLSLTTYAWEDYDSICGAFYNGLYYLEDVL